MARTKVEVKIFGSADEAKANIGEKQKVFVVGDGVRLFYAVAKSLAAATVAVAATEFGIVGKNLSGRTRKSAGDRLAAKVSKLSNEEKEALRKLLLSA